MSERSIVACFAGLVIAGCYEPELADCRLICNGEVACPDDMTCGAEGRCRSPGATEACSEIIAPTTLAETAYIKASNSQANDNFGYAIALSRDGTTLAVGALFEASASRGIDGDQNDNSAASSGAVYVFVRSGDSWQQQAYVKASNADRNDNFGTSVALSADGNTLAVGAQSEASAGNEDDNTAPDAGAVYVFRRTAGTWAQDQYLKPASAAGGDKAFGASVSLADDGTRLAVGAPAEAALAGAFYIFERDASWTQKAHFIGSVGAVQGSSVAMSGDGSTLVVGAPFENGEVGAALVFVRGPAAWSFQSRLVVPVLDGNDWLGNSLAISRTGDHVAVAAPFEDGGGGIDGDQTDDSLSDSGAVFVFARTNTVWVQDGYVKASNRAAGDQFARGMIAMSADGATIAAGATYKTNGTDGVNAGAVYVFERSASSWTERDLLTASNIEPRDEFGSAVALSADGTTLVASSAREDGAARGVDGERASNEAPESGAVYIFE